MSLEAVKKSVESILNDPSNHDFLAVLKGFRNGIVYGTKIRLPHAMVMVFLFRSGTFREKVGIILKATFQHAKNLGVFVTIYKSAMLLMKFLSEGKEERGHSFAAGLLGGYLVFGRGMSSSVNQQIVLYVFARVMMALAKLSVEKGYVANPGGKTSKYASPVFASLSWAAVMYLFRWHPETIQPSLRSSMKYLYINSDHWDSLRNFVVHNV